MPAVARAERRWSFAAAATALGAGMAVRFDVVDLAMDHRISRPHEVFSLFALGWAAARSTTWPQRVAVTIAALAATLNFFGDLHRELIVAAGFALLAWVPTVPAPRPVLRLFHAGRAASLYIYLTHFQVYPAVNRALGPAAIASLVVGVVASVLARRVSSEVARATQARRKRPGLTIEPCSA